MLPPSITPTNRSALHVRAVTKVTDLTTNELNLFNLLCLLVDIRYRQRYDVPIEYSGGRGYSKNVQFDKVLADQLPSVDDGLLGYNRREVSGNEPRKPS